MGKSVFIAEKPSVAQEFGKALHENFTRRDGFLESDNYIVTSWYIPRTASLCASIFPLNSSLFIIPSACAMNATLRLCSQIFSLLVLRMVPHLFTYFILDSIA